MLGNSRERERERERALENLTLELFQSVSQQQKIEIFVFFPRKIIYYRFQF